MLIREGIVCLLGLICGASIAAGVVALISSLGIIPRIVGKSATARWIMLYEMVLFAGAALGAVLAIYELPLSNWIYPWMQQGILIMGGIFAGIFFGCLAAALAEVIQIWPVLYRRLNMKYGNPLVMTGFAVGKLVGSLYFFLLMKYLV